jgi:hypothetical protein
MTTRTDVELTARPTTIADAVVLHARLGALSDWIGDRQKAVRGFVEARALTRMDEDGAAPTWRVDGGTALLTDPTPRVTIDDPDAFARWYVAEVLGADPDADPDDRRVFFDDDRILRQARASVDEAALLDLAALPADADDATAAAAARTVAARVETVTQWAVPAGLPDDLLAGKAGTADPDRPRVRLVDADGWLPIDTATGEVVPGLRVAPPGRRTVQIRPAAATKKAVAAELRDLIGPPALDGGVG